MRKSIAVVLFLGSTLSSRPLHAQVQPPALSMAPHIKCVFTIVSTAVWSRTGELTPSTKPANLVLEYKNISTSDGSAEALGFTGSFFINARFVGSSLHLLATADAGPVYLTTVFDRQSHPGKYKAVHTRHELTDVVLPGYTSSPEQYFGECEILN